MTSGFYPTVRGRPSATALRIGEEFQRLVALCVAEGWPVGRDPCYGKASGAAFIRDVFQDFAPDPFNDTSLVLSLVEPAAGLRRSNIQVHRDGQPLTRLPPPGPMGSTRWDRE